MSFEDCSALDVHAHMEFGSSRRAVSDSLLPSRRILNTRRRVVILTGGLLSTSKDKHQLRQKLRACVAERSSKPRLSVPDHVGAKWRQRSRRPHFGADSTFVFEVPWPPFSLPSPFSVSFSFAWKPEAEAESVSRP